MCRTCASRSARRTRHGWSGTVAEPTVQVPVSQVTQWRNDLQALLPPGTYAILREIDALLSQPTPSADEPPCTCGHQGFDHGHSEGDGCLHCPCREFAATPPRIEDMAPGTTRELDERDFPDEEEQRNQAIIDAIDDWAPSIDDMTIGTTFRAPHSNLETDHVRLWVRTSRGLLDLTDVTTDGRYTTVAVNPSTVRDVQPPARREED